MNLKSLKKILLVRLDLYSNFLAICIAIVLVAMFTSSAWKFASDSAENEAGIRFESRAKQVAEAIRGRMVDYEQVLRGGAGLYAASASVERGEWRAYVEHLRIEKVYPGILAIGFVQRVLAGEKERHELVVQKEGFPGYAIRPPGDRVEYAPVIYIEPFGDRNLRAFGFDMMSDRQRRATLERARDTGEPAISGRLTLVQDTGEDAQAGFLMFVPVYRNILEVSTIAQRRSAVIGYIYSPFRADELMAGILGKLSDMRLRIFDEGPEGVQLLYDSRPGAGPLEDPRFTFTLQSPTHGRNWKMNMTSLPEFDATVDSNTPLLVAGATGAMSLLLLAIIWSLATTRARAINLARTMTQELRASREQLALAMEGANQALFDWDVQSGKVVLSERWSRITGCGLDGLTTTIDGLLSMVHPDDVDAVRQQAADLIRGRVIFYHVEHRVRVASGEWRWISSQAKVVERNPSGRALRVAGTNVDISDRKEIERLKAEFVSTVSHELRTPLTALIGSLGLLDRQVEGKLAPDATMFLKMARQNGERLAALINNILDIEKIESGQMEFRHDAIAIRPLLERAVLLNAPYAEKLGVRFELGAADDAVVSGDPDRLLQVLTNLMSNGAKFTPQGTAVTVSAALHDGSVRVSVADNGPGIPEEFRGRIFGKFAQADASDTRAKGGTGLGLSISRAIVEKLGGKMDYESVPGRGATFYFDLPLRH